MCDELTQLRSRKEFFIDLKNCLAQGTNSDQKSALLVLKIQQFKAINTTFGYEVGDSLLVSVAQRVTEVCRESDVLARIGHNSFAVLLGTIMNQGHANLAVNKLLDVLHEPFMSGGEEFNIKVSIGASLYPEDASEPERVLRNAEVALDQANIINAKSAFYIERAPATQSDCLTLEHELKQAIKNGGLTLHYQPQIDMVSGSVCGAEALLRWEHPELGRISPSVFVPIAEKSGLIDSLTTWVLNTALRQTSQYQEQYGTFTIAVNLSATLLHDQDIVELINNALLMWGIAPESLLLEVTETAMMEYPLQSLEVLRKLNAAGIQISIDDFGTGYSSLAYLKQLPVNELKIDQSFVLSMTENASDLKIVQSIIDLAHTFDLKVVAEGIENETIFATLRQMGCDIGQGFYFGKGMDVDDFCQWMESSSWSDDIVPLKSHFGGT